MYFATASIAGMVAGRIVDRYGPKRLLIIASVVTGSAFFLLGRVTELWQFFAIYFVMAAAWSGTGLVPISTVIANWFIRRRGFAMGLTMAGLSLGGMILVPLAAFLISRWGLRVALEVLGAAWLFIIPVALFLITQRPSDIGQYPDGEDRHPLSQAGIDASPLYASQARIWTGAEAMRTTAFWAIVASFLLTLTGQNAFLFHQISFLSQTLGPMGAATAVSVTTGASIAGRLFLGPVSDRYDKRFIAMGCFLFQALAVLALSFFRQTTVLYLGTFVFGLSMGALLMMQSLLIGECFGFASFGTISGLSGLFSGLGSACGPAIAGLIFDATHDYRIAFLIFAAAGFSAMGTIFFARPPMAASSAAANASPCPARSDPAGT
jgi:MFS family permease